MKVAVSSKGKDLASQIEPRFGRCPYFLIVDTDDMRFEAFDNENATLGGGAGIQAAQFVASKGAEVLTGNCGPNAVRTLSAAGITLFVNQKGTVKEVIDRYKNRELTSATDAECVGAFRYKRWKRDGPWYGYGPRKKYGSWKRDGTWRDKLE